MRVRVAILVVSDGVHAGTRTDASGEAIAAWARDTGRLVTQRAVVPDEEDAIVAALERWVEGHEADLILTTGGTGFSSRDVTPEATWSVIEREAPGIAEAIRARGMQATPTAALSRGIAGIAQQVLIVNLPGSPAGVRDGLAVLQPLVDHAAAILRDQTEH